MLQRLTAVALCAACGLCAPVGFSFAADGQGADRSGSRPAVRLVQNRSRGDRSESDAKKPAGLPGFGGKADRPVVSGFGTGGKKPADDEPGSDRGKERRREERPRDRNREDRPREGGGRDGGGSGERGGSGGGGGNDDQAKIRKYAESLLSRYDENKNGVLERDEWKKMSGEPEKGDANGDGRITLDELTVRLASYGKKSGGGSSSDSSPSKREPPRESGEPQRPASDDDEKPDDRPREPGNFRRPSEPSGPSGSGDYSSGPRGGRSVGRAKRFLTPTERLPEGLPSFFARCDADADGQVTMAEFASGWSDSKVAEFNKYDLDGDGVIAPAEALRAEKNRK